MIEAPTLRAVGSDPMLPLWTNTDTKMRVLFTGFYRYLLYGGLLRNVFALVICNSTRLIMKWSKVELQPSSFVL